MNITDFLSGMKSRAGLQPGFWCFIAFDKNDNFNSLLYCQTDSNPGKEVTGNSKIQFTYKDLKTFWSTSALLKGLI